MLLRDAGLAFSVGLTVPEAGRSVLGALCETDPAVSGWARAIEIVTDVVSKKLGEERLRHRQCACAIANATMSFAEVIADQDTRS